jgi:hypothetical protein
MMLVKISEEGRMAGFAGKAVGVGSGVEVGVRVEVGEGVMVGVGVMVAVGRIGEAVGVGGRGVKVGV